MTIYYNIASCQQSTQEPRNTAWPLEELVHDINIVPMLA